MNVEELAMACASAMNAGRNWIQLVVPGGPPNGETVRLDQKTRKKCPVGEVLNWQDDPPRTLASFDVLEILAWLVANGWVSLNGSENPNG